MLAIRACCTKRVFRVAYKPPKHLTIIFSMNRSIPMKINSEDSPYIKV